MDTKVKLAKKAAFERIFWTGVVREVAHQMGTPLSALMGWLELLPETEDPNRIVLELKAGLDRLNLACERLHQIGTHPRAVAFSLQEACAEVVDYFSARMPSGAEGVNIHCEIPIEIRIRGSQVLLVWALEHLFKNALDVLPRKGGNISLLVEVTAGQVQVDLTDDGEGIAVKMRSKIFIPGFSTRIGGRGIGLPLAKYIIEELHRGELTLHSSELGKGTTLRIKLPISP